MRKWKEGGRSAVSLPASLAGAACRFSGTQGCVYALVGHGTVSPTSFALKISVPFNTESPGRYRVSPIVKVLGIFLEFLPDDFLNRKNDICKSILVNREANSVTFLGNMQMRC